MKKLFLLLAAVVTFVVLISQSFACGGFAYEPKMR